MGGGVADGDGKGHGVAAGRGAVQAQVVGCGIVARERPIPDAVAVEHRRAAPCRHCIGERLARGGADRPDAQGAPVHGTARAERVAGPAAPGCRDQRDDAGRQ